MDARQVSQQADEGAAAKLAANPGRCLRAVRMRPKSNKMDENPNACPRFVFAMHEYERYATVQISLTIGNIADFLEKGGPFAIRV